MEQGRQHIAQDAQLQDAPAQQPSNIKAVSCCNRHNNKQEILSLQGTVGWQNGLTRGLTDSAGIIINNQKDVVAPWLAQDRGADMLAYILPCKEFILLSISLYKTNSGMGIHHGLEAVAVQTGQHLIEATASVRWRPREKRTEMAALTKMRAADRSRAKGPSGSAWCKGSPLVTDISLLEGPTFIAMSTALRSRPAHHTGAL